MGKDFKPQRFDGTDLFEGDTGEAVPDVDNLRDEFDIWVEMEPGDALRQFRTLHGMPCQRLTKPPPCDFDALGWG